MAANIDTKEIKCPLCTTTAINRGCAPNNIPDEHLFVGEGNEVYDDMVSAYICQPCDFTFYVPPTRD